MLGRAHLGAGDNPLIAMQMADDELGTKLECALLSSDQVGSLGVTMVGLSNPLPLWVLAHDMLGQGSNSRSCGSTEKNARAASHEFAPQESKRGSGWWKILLSMSCCPEVLSAVSSCRFFAVPS